MSYPGPGSETQPHYEAPGNLQISHLLKVGPWLVDSNPSDGLSE